MMVVLHSRKMIRSTPSVSQNMINILFLTVNIALNFLFIGDIAYFGKISHTKFPEVWLILVASSTDQHTE
jgi:hypothetical protein